MREDDTISILHVEDSDTDAVLFQVAVEKAGGGVFTVHRARNVREAVGRAALPGIDLIVLDLGLVGSDGLDPLRAMTRELPGLPIVVLTGHEDLVRAAMAVRAGAQDVLFKGAQTDTDLLRSLILSLERFSKSRELEQRLRHEQERVRDLNHKLTAWKQGRATPL